jgi:hypothetical protein
LLDYTSAIWPSIYIVTDENNFEFKISEVRERPTKTYPFTMDITENGELVTHTVRCTEG